MIVRKVEGVDRIRVGGRRRHIFVYEARDIGPCRSDGGTVSVHGIAGDAAGGRRPGERDPCGGHAGGPEAGGRGGWHGRCGGIGMEDGAHGVPVGDRGKGGRPVLAARGARPDVLLKSSSARCLRPGRVRYAQAASGRHRSGAGRGYYGGEHELARIHGRGRTGVDGPSVGKAPGDDLVERAGGGDARVVSDGSLQVGARGDGHGDGHPAGRRLAVLAVVEGDVARVVQEGQRSGRPRPGAVHVVRYLDLRGGVVLGHPRDQEIPLRHRAGERDADRRDLPGRECHPLDEGHGRRPCRGRRRGGRGRRRGGGPGGGRRGGGGGGGRRGGGPRGGRRGRGRSGGGRGGGPGGVRRAARRGGARARGGGRGPRAPRPHLAPAA